MPQNPFVLVRVKTPDKRKGHLARRYTFEGKRFDCDNGWYKVGRAQGTAMGQLLHPANNLPIFDVVELPEAQEIDEKEKGEEWARGATPAAKAPAVKIKDFKRREEIKEEVAAREGAIMSESDWDDTFDPMADDDEEEEDEGETGDIPAAATAPKAKKTGKRSSRRSAGK